MLYRWILLFLLLPSVALGQFVTPGGGTGSVDSIYVIDADSTFDNIGKKLVIREGSEIDFNFLDGDTMEVNIDYTNFYPIKAIPAPDQDDVLKIDTVGTDSLYWAVDNTSAGAGLIVTEELGGGQTSDSMDFQRPLDVTQSGDALSTINILFDGSTIDTNGSGQLEVGTITTGNIGNETIIEEDLKATAGAVDEDILTWEITGLEFEWHTPAELYLLGWADSGSYNEVSQGKLVVNTEIYIGNAADTSEADSIVATLGTVQTEIADSLDEYSLTSAIEALIADSLDEYSLTVDIQDSLDIVRDEIRDTVIAIYPSVGEINTLSDTGTFNGTEGFGLAGGKTGTALKVKGLIEGSNISIAASGDSAYTITGSAGGSGTTDSTYINDGTQYGPFTNDMFKIKEGTAINIVREDSTTYDVFMFNVNGVTTTEITDQTITEADMDTTNNDYVVGAMYKITSAEPDSEFTTAGQFFPLRSGTEGQDYVLFLDRTGGDTTYWAAGGSGETNTIGDTGTFNGTEGFGLAGGKTGVMLKVKGLIEGGYITIAASGDSAYTIAGSGIEALIADSLDEYSLTSAIEALIADSLDEYSLTTAIEALIADSLDEYSLTTAIQAGYVAKSDSGTWDEIANKLMLNQVSIGNASDSSEADSGVATIGFVQAEIEDSLNEYSLTTAVEALIADSLDEYSLTTAIEALIADSLDEYSLTTAIQADYVAKDDSGTWDEVADKLILNQASLGNAADSGVADSGIATKGMVKAEIADSLDEYSLTTAIVLRDGSQALTANWPAGDYDVTGLEKVSADSVMPKSDYTGQIGSTTLRWDKIYTRLSRADTLRPPINNTGVVGTAILRFARLNSRSIAIDTLIAANDAQLPNNSISDEELDEGATFAWTAGHTFTGTVDIQSTAFTADSAQFDGNVDIDSADFNGTVNLDGQTIVGTGAVASFALQAVNNPTTNAEGEIAWDANDDAIEVYSGDEAESGLIPFYKKISLLISQPDSVQAYSDSLPIFHANALMFPFGIEIDLISITLEADAAYSLVLQEWNNADPPVYQNVITTVATGAADSYAEEAPDTDGNLTVGERIYMVLPTTDVPSVMIEVYYHITEGN